MAQFSHVDTFAASASKVGALFSSQELWQARQNALVRWTASQNSRELGALPDLLGQLAQAKVLNDWNGGSRLEFVVSLSPQALGNSAAMVKSFLSGDVRAHVKEEWAPPAPDGSRKGTVEIRLDKPQVTVVAQAHLYPTETGCQRRLDGSVSVGIPLVGAVLAGKAAGHVGSLCSADAAVVRTLL